MAALVLLVLFSWRPVLATVGKRLCLPERDQGKTYSVLPESKDYELVRLKTADGVDLVGQFGIAKAPANPAAAPTVIFFYGSSQTIAAPHNRTVFEALRTMGVNVLTVDLPGHGMSAGDATEAGCYAAGEAALAYLLTRPGVNGSRIVVVGQSRGSGPAVELASRHEVAGLILVCPFTSVADVLAVAFPWLPRFGAEQMAAWCRFDNVAKIRSVKCPILIVHGGADATCPPHMVDRLAVAATAPVTRHVVEFSDHNSLWKSPRYGLDATVQTWLQAR